MTADFNQMTPRLSKYHLPVAQNASGRNLNVPIYRISDGLQGPNVYIQSSIHGAEVQGNVVIHHLIQALKSIKVKGIITLVPNCNPVGTNIKAGEYTLGRFDPVNGTNWNRGYFFDEEWVKDFGNKIQATLSTEEVKTQFRKALTQKIIEKQRETWGVGLAQQLNLSLQRLAVDADIVLDLHNGPVSTRHVYIPEYAKASANLFSIPHCILIPNKFAGALDEATFCPWWTLKEELITRHGMVHQFNVEAFTLEMGSQEVINFDEGKKDAHSILAYLNAKGAIEANQFQPANIKRIGVYLRDYKTLYTDFGGMVEYCAKPGDWLKKGEPLARILNIDDLDNDHCTRVFDAPCDMIPILHFPSASVLSGTQLYKCFTNFFEIN